MVRRDEGMGGGEGERTFKLSQDSVHSSRAAAATHADVELVGVFC
jgi:hypothetical protein